MNIITRAMNANALRQVEPLDTLLFEGEVNAHQFVITPAAGVSFEGASVMAYFVRSDTQRVDLTGQVSGGNAVVTISGNCCAVAGRYKLTIFAVTADETAAIYACAGTVQGTRGSEVAGDTEPIVEPASPSAVESEVNDMTKLLWASSHLSAIWDEDLSYEAAADGSITANGVTITRTKGVIEIHGTVNAGSGNALYIPLSHGDLHADVIGFISESDIQDRSYEYGWNTSRQYYDGTMCDLSQGRLFCVVLSGTNDNARGTLFATSLAGQTSYDRVMLDNYGCYGSGTFDFMGTTARLLFLILQDGVTYNHYRILPTIASDVAP